MKKVSAQCDLLSCRVGTDLDVVAKLGEEVSGEAVDGGAVVGAEDGRRELGLDVVHDLLDSVDALRNSYA